MNNKFVIYPVRDESDKQVCHIHNLFDLPMRIAIIGSTGSGKTNLLVNLVGHPDYYGDCFEGENIYIISGSLKNDQKIKNLVKLKDIPTSNLFDRYNENEIQILYDYIKDKFNEEELDKELTPHRRLIIFDDISFSGGLKNKQFGVITEMICNSRKINVSLIFTSQKYSHLSTCIRTNLSGAIFFQVSSRELELITEDWNYLDDKKKFVKIFRDSTNVPRGTFIVNLSNSPNQKYMSDFNNFISI
jgi:hypothetical protein